MPGRYTYFLITVIFLCCNHPSLSQEREYIYDHFNISNGLISDNVYKIFVDSEGHAWIITYNGLQKYNGYEFETYTSNTGVPGTLSSNFVEDIFEDRQGDLIIILEDGIDIYNKQTGRFTNLLSDLPFGEARRNEISRQASAVQDRSGSVWVNCNNQLVRIDSSKHDFFVYQNEFRGRFILNKDSIILWIITDHTIKNYNLQTKLLTITDIDDIAGPAPVQRLNTIFYDSENICWIGTTEGLFKFDEENYRFIDPGISFPGDAGLPDYSAVRNITAIYEDFRKNLWVASGSILYRIDRITMKARVLQHETENPNSILEGQITGIHGAKSGIIWVTYLNEGFTRINIKTKNFRSYRFNANLGGSLGGNTVRSVFKDETGYIWLGLYNNGLDRIDPHTGTVEHFKHDPDDERSICSNYISSLLVDNHGRLWVGSHDNGLCFTDHMYGEDPGFHAPSFLNSNDEIYHIQDDSLGRIWFGTRDGLGVFDYDLDSFHWVLRDHNIQSFLFDNHTIWIASWNRGLCRLSFTQDQFVSRFPEFDTLTSKYSHDGELNVNPTVLRNCISIYQDQQGTIWLGTYDRGLAKAVERVDHITYEIYDVSRGAPGNAVYGVTGDQNGQIWVSTEHGIGKFDPVSERFENYYREDGLLSNYFMWKSYFKASDGELFFGSMDGLNLFYPDEIERDTVNPRVFVSEFRIQNRVIEFGDTVHGDIILKRHITYQDTLVLNHWNRNFSFGFYAAEHENPDRLRYSHMLEGFDEEWILNARGTRNATYSNLSPGTYHFRVRATENETNWPDSFEEKMLIILPPWWKTKLAYAVYFLLIAGLIFLITHTLIRFIGLKHELIYNEKLHQSKLMFFTNISHEFKTPLSLIQAPLNDILNEKALSPHNRKNFQVARENADNLLNLVNELMEFRRTDTGISKIRSEQIELTEFIKEITAQFECIAEQKGVHFYSNIPEEKIQIWVDRKKFRRIINNLLANALKYTSGEGLVTLSIVEGPVDFSFKPNYHTLHLNRSTNNPEYIGILVSDTGVGISKESLPKIFDRFYQIEAERASHHIGSGIGLALVKNLVLMHHGEIRVASERRVGTEILVLLPLGDKHLAEDDKMSPGQSLFAEAQQAGVSHQVAEPESANDPAGSYSLPRILIVEDHADLRQYLSDHLSEEYRILLAANGAEGMDILRENRPDLILTDWIMPVMDGAAFIRELKSDDHTSDIPVILLTARDELLDKQKGLELGADLVITKPFNLQLLKSQLKRVVENNRSRMKKYSMQHVETRMDLQGNRDARFIEKAERIIRERITEPSLNASVVARELGVSRTVLYDRMKEITGQTIGECIHRIRLKHAINLMLYENIPVSELYVMVGISSSSYLIRLFKKYYHTTPKEYIRNYLKTASN